jgi:adenylate cyclase class IV
MDSKKNTSTFERELKLDLETVTNHALLEKHLRSFPASFRFLGTKEQINIFFDTPDRFLRSQKIALRLRQEGEKFFLTAKGAKIKTGDLIIRPEIECEIPVPEAFSVLQNKKNIAELNYPPLSWIGTQTQASGLSFHEILRFTNQRQNFLFPPFSLILELDHTHYIHGDSFELEIEFQNEADYPSAKKILQTILNEKNIPWKISAQSKYARALQFLFPKTL